MHQQGSSPSLDQFRRDPEAPPSDSLAEAIVLGGLLDDPSLLGTVDLTGLLCFPEHRAMWQAMLRVPAEMRTDMIGFFCAWRRDLCERHCADRAPHEFWTVQCSAYLMWTSVTAAHQAEPEWVDEQYEQTRMDDPRRSVHYHDWRWWLERLKRCATARRLLSDAQEMAERAWQEDVDGALSSAVRAAGRRTAVKEPGRASDW